MQFHIFTAIFTCVVFVYLKYNKEQYDGDYSLYAVIIPILLYGYNYNYNYNYQSNDLRGGIKNVESIVNSSILEPSLMTDTYPMSSSN